MLGEAKDPMQSVGNIDEAGALPKPIAEKLY
jgi:hypothetical protein